MATAAMSLRTMKTTSHARRSPQSKREYMKYALIWLLGASTASAWFAASLWSKVPIGEGTLQGLWIIPSILTIGTLIGAFFVVADEQDS